MQRRGRPQEDPLKRCLFTFDRPRGRATSVSVGSDPTLRRSDERVNACIAPQNGRTDQCYALCSGSLVHSSWHFPRNSPMGKWEVRRPRFCRGRLFQSGNQSCTPSSETKYVSGKLVLGTVVPVALLSAHVGMASLAFHVGIGYVRGHRRRVDVSRASARPSDTSWFDAYKEKARSRRATSYTSQDWPRHRSSRRFFRDLVTLPTSAVFVALVEPLAALGGCALAACLLGTHFPKLQLNPLPLQLTASALALLLVLRTNRSYARWLDVRRTFGEAHATVREVARKCACWIMPLDPPRAEGVARATAAFFECLNAKFQPTSTSRSNGGSDESQREALEDALRALFVDPSDARLVAWAPHPTLAALQMASTHAREARGLGEKPLMELERDLSILSRCLGSCERMFSTPVCLPYKRHTTRALALWLALLPFALWSSLGWMTLPCTWFVSFLLLGIDEVGMQMEEPFSVLPLRQIARMAVQDVLDVLSTQVRVEEACRSPVAP